MNAVVEVKAQESRAVVATRDSGALMQLIERALTSPDFDINKLQQLIDVKERWDKIEARKAFDAAISAAKAEIKPIVKKREVDFTSQKGRTNYKYEDFALIAEEVDPILGKHGLSYRHRAKQEGKKLTITCILSHRDGHYEETDLFADNDESGNKNSIQGVGSTATYLQRYTLKLALGLSAAKDDDGNSSGGKGGTEAPKSPDGYEKWRADMTAAADEGGGKFDAAFAASDIAFRNYAVKADKEWWAESKAKSRKVPQ